MAAAQQPNVSDPSPERLAAVLLGELDDIRDRRGVKVAQAKQTQQTSSTLEDHRRQVHDLGDLSALCLSGGGIRSAAFALGVVQALAARGILAKFDYLSTVSGGGYLGAWLTAWVQRYGYDRVAAELAKGGPPSGFSPLRHLRTYSSFLTPRKGLFTQDALTIVAFFVRNMVLNWLVILPMLVVPLIVIKGYALVFWRSSPTEQSVLGLGLAAFVLIGWAVLDSLQQRPGWESRDSTLSAFAAHEVAPLFLAGLATGFAAWHSLERGNSLTSDWWALAVMASSWAILSGLAWMLAFLVVPQRRPGLSSTRATVRTRLTDALKTLASIALGGALSGTVLFLMLRSVETIAWLAPSDLPAAWSLVLLCLGPAMVTASYFAGELVHLGGTSFLPWADEEREWTARASGYHTKCALVWALVTALPLAGSHLVYSSWSEASSSFSIWLAGTGVSAGAIVAFVGKASATAATVRERYNTWKNMSAAVVLAIATPVFIVILVSFASAAIDRILLDRPLDRGAALAADSLTLSVTLAFMLAGVVAVWLLASFFININRFSLHGLYRNRLTRAFLGASNRDRKPNRFTDLDEADNLKLHELWPATARKLGQQPPQLLIVNCALNIVATTDLAWQERKAQSFIATPRWTGSGELEGEGAFRSSADYAEGLSLGTAITISGAAASPNMGYHSSPALSLLLTLFNVRLGAWLGNPARPGQRRPRWIGARLQRRQKRPFERQGPFFAVKPMFYEAAGLTTADKPYIYLSDGGHFENLGLYEAVRRRCRFIVVSDAGCDPEVGFEDLGNAVRRISIDFNVRIRFRSLTLEARKMPPVSGPYCAVADVVYPERPKKPGMLLYVKPGYQGGEPASVRSYASANPAFPHESTADQFFGESQFEAYRALGEHVLAGLDGGDREFSSIEDFMNTAASRLARRTNEPPRDGPATRPRTATARPAATRPVR